MTLLELLELLKKHLRLVVTLPLICAVAAAAVSWLVLPNTYTASVSMYMLTKSDGESSSISSSDLSASQMLANDVTALVKSDRVTSDTAAALQMTSLKGYDVDVESSTTTRLLTVSVTGESAQSVAIIANKIAEVTDSVAREVMDIQSVNVVDQAVEPDEPSGPPRLMYTAVALLAGLFLAVAAVVVMDMLNTRVRSAEEAEELLGLPVIGRIPEMKN